MKKLFLVIVVVGFYGSAIAQTGGSLPPSGIPGTDNLPSFPNPGTSAAPTNNPNRIDTSGNSIAPDPATQNMEQTTGSTTGGSTGQNMDENNGEQTGQEQDPAL